MKNIYLFKEYNENYTNSNFYDRNEYIIDRINNYYNSDNLKFNYIETILDDYDFSLSSFYYEESNVLVSSVDVNYVNRSRDLLQKIYKVVNYLLTHGADKYIDSTNGNDTALTVAAYWGYLIVIELLIDYGANIYQKDDDGKGILDFETHHLVKDFMKQNYPDLYKKLMRDKMANNFNI